MAKMGLLFGRNYFKRKFRWFFTIPDFVNSEDLSANALPPFKAARPAITFKEITIEHLVETVYVPGKPDWSTLEITLYDLKCNKNPMFTWLKRLYDVSQSRVKYNYLVLPGNGGYKIQQADLVLTDGCGNEIEHWVYEGVWAQKIEWGDLDMSSSEVVTVDVSLRYDRAYFLDPDEAGAGGGGAGGGGNLNAAL